MPKREQSRTDFVYRSYVYTRCLGAILPGWTTETAANRRPPPVGRQCAIFVRQMLCAGGSDLTASRRHRSSTSPPANIIIFASHSHAISAVFYTLQNTHRNTYHRGDHRERACVCAIMIFTTRNATHRKSHNLFAKITNTHDLHFAQTVLWCPNVNEFNNESDNKIVISGYMFLV